MRENLTKLLHIGIVSHLRPENVPAIEAAVGLPVTWYVGAGEVEAYRSAGAKSVVEGGSLVQSRNKVLVAATVAGLYAVEISDDFKSIGRIVLEGGKKVVHEITVAEALSVLYEELKASPFHLAGIPPTANPFYCKTPRNYNAFIIGDFFMVKPPAELFFDGNLRLKEDYDFTAQHLRKYGGALRVNTIVAEFKHYTNAGGAVSYRNAEVEQAAIAYIMEKHAGLFKLNPRRQNEILFNTRAKRA